MTRAVTIADVAARLDDLAVLVRSALTRKPPTAKRKTLSANQAAKVYGRRAETLIALFQAGEIEGRAVPGRGRAGVEYSLSVASLDRYFRTH